MKIIKFLILLLLFIPIKANACERCGGDLNVWNATEPESTPVENDVIQETVQPDYLLPIGSPWVGGENDGGYCPDLWGWGWTGNLRWPVTNYTALREFGYLPGTTHTGLDLSVPVGTPVYAPTSGKIIWAGGNSTGFGNQNTGLVAIASSGYKVLLAHLSDVSVSCGQDIYVGQFVGLSGQSGAASWPHLHIEIRRNGYSYNPMLWLN